MFLPSEWHEQEFVQLTWPHEQTDWAPILTEATQCFLSMAAEISKREKLVILAQNPYEVSKQIETCTLFTQAARQRITILSCLNNDTWARDHAFISCLHHDGSKTTRHLLDYQFNGWGMKFPSNFDNQLNKNLYQSLNQEDNIYINNLDFVLEGGSVESDGKGTILTTSSCLLAPNRNDTYTRSQIEERLLRDFHAKQVLWLDYGHLEGDDTDGHIDTLARFCPNDTIAYVRCNDKSDSQTSKTPVESNAVQNGEDTYDNPFQVSLDEIKSMKVVLSGENYRIYNGTFCDNVIEARWWDYESTMSSPGVYKITTKTLSFSIEVKPETEAPVYYAYYYSEDGEFDLEDMAEPIYSNEIEPEKYNDGKAYYNIDCGKGIKKGYFAVVVAKDSTLNEPYALAYAEVK